MEPAAALLELQDADLGVTRTGRELDGLPEKKAILEIRRKTREVQALLDKTHAYAAEVGRAVSRAEDETSGLDAKLAAEQKRLTSGEVSDHREVQHLTREMDSLRRRKDKLEMETIALMEKGEKAEAQSRTIVAAIAKLASDEQALVERFKQAGSVLLTRIESLKARRASLAAGLPADVLAAYESARETKHGIGAARLTDGVCGACRVELPADKLHLLLDGPAVAECPMCRRLLVVHLPADTAAQ
ncbi:MAG: hypothetical protein C0418_05740 [Coriobacteriaceae bacterium]|nr:hypothetical protein [Coriobacteriaceae bacterium]